MAGDKKSSSKKSESKSPKKAPLTSSELREKMVYLNISNGHELKQSGMIQKLKSEHEAGNIFVYLPKQRVCGLENDIDKYIEAHELKNPVMYSYKTYTSKNGDKELEHEVTSAVKNRKSVKTDAVATLPPFAIVRLAEQFNEEQEREKEKRKATSPRRKAAGSPTAKTLKDRVAELNKGEYYLVSKKFDVNEKGNAVGLIRRDDHTSKNTFVWHKFIFPVDARKHFIKVCEEYKGMDRSAAEREWDETESAREAATVDKKKRKSTKKSDKKSAKKSDKKSTAKKSASKKSASKKSAEKPKPKEQPEEESDEDDSAEEFKKMIRNRKQRLPTEDDE